MSRSLTALVLIVAACASGEAPPTGGSGAVATVAITPDNFTVVIGDTLRFSAVARDAGGGVVSAGVTWGATGGSVSTAGLFTAGGAAALAKVWATADGVTDTASGLVTTTAVTIDTVFAEGFESGTFAPWQDRGLPLNHAIINDAARAQSGSRFLEITYPANSDGGWLTRFFMPGYDTIYVSYWMKLEPGWVGGTKLILLWGSRTDNQWSAAGTSGLCPSGTDFFKLAVTSDSAAPPGPVSFYTSWPAMPREADGVTCFGRYADAGTTYTPPRELSVGSWHFIEFAAILNTPGQSNLQQKFWIDGVLRGEWTGLSVRTSNILKLNALTLTNSSAGVSALRRMLVDNVLVARQRPGGF